MDPYQFADAQYDTFLAELMDLLRIPTISALSEHKPDIRRAADWLRDHLLAAGMTRAEVLETPGNPVVYAEWLGAGPGAKTALIYGHYDVQPVDDADNLWQTDPFEPTVRDGRLYARGATDDKGQTFTQIAAVRSLLASSALPVNVKFIVEGEEEVGSSNLYGFVESHPDLLAADVVVISDSSIISLDIPSIVTGLRGLTYVEIEVRGPSHDLHSGMYGGLVHNPAQALVELLAQMHDAEGRVTIPGFYDDVVELSAEERALLAEVPYTLERLEHETGVKHAWGEPEYAMQERLGIRPTLEINGIVGGWTGEGGKTVLPAKALAKVSCRLVPNQDPDGIEQLIRDFVAERTPPTVTSVVRGLHNGMWAMVDPDSPYVQAALEAYTFGFGKRPVFQREGGSIPIVGTFQKVLGAPVVMMGFGLPDDNLHAPNEKFSLTCFRNGLKTAMKFYQLIGEMGRE